MGKITSEISMSLDGLVVSFVGMSWPPVPALAQAVASWAAFPCWRIRIGLPNGSRTPMSVP
jgi:hypothetical protein